MSSDAWQILVVNGWMIAFMLGMVGVFVWRVRRRGTQAPLTKKLLRGPGESLRRKVVESDENLFLWMMLGSLTPILLGSLALRIAITAGREWSAYALAVGAVVFLASLVAVATWILRKLNYRRNCALGYYGERIVGEYLEPLKERGYTIFHDLPAQGRKKDFNIDHVAVGISGVVVIETKTRRKGRCRPAYDAATVRFDGNHLIWPWTEDRFGIDQVINNAKWLHKFLLERTGQSIPVRPILTIPGWYVDEIRSEALRVITPEFLCDAVHGNGDRVLSDEQIKLISLQLDLICRDVED